MNTEAENKTNKYLKGIVANLLLFQQRTRAGKDTGIGKQDS